MKEKLSLMKIKIQSHLPVSRKTYATTLSSLIKILEAGKEAEMFLRNDVYQLGKVVHEIKDGKKEKGKKEEKDNVSGMFG